MREILTRRKRKDDDWIENLLKLGLGVLALSFLAKLAEKPSEIKQCPFCRQSIGKWAITCPNCRNNLGL